VGGGCNGGGQEVLLLTGTRTKRKGTKRTECRMNDRVEVRI
jgi:hypothetical protein